MASDSVIVNIFCENLRRLRKINGVTQIDMATRLGMTQSSYSKLERGSFAPTIVTVARVAESLGASPDELLSPLVKEKASMAS